MFFREGKENQGWGKIEIDMGIADKIYKRKEKNRLKIRRNALKDAKHIAYVLGRHFGAKEVILYGSLSQGKYFDRASDIDIAVKGLEEKYLKAYGYCLRLSKFDLDLRSYEDMPHWFRERVNKQGRCLYAKK